MTIDLPGDSSISVPQWVTCILFVIGMVIIAQVGLWLFNKLGWQAGLEQNNEVTGIIFGAIGLIYSLMLAFVIVAVWDDYNNLDKTIETETDRLNSILAHTSNLPDKLKAIVGKSIYDYCDQVVNQEWRMQKTRIEYPSAIPVLRQELLNIQPESQIQERVFDAVDKDLSSISDLHRERLSHTHTQMPPLIWQILKAGTIILIVFTYFFHVPSDRLKRVYLTFTVVSVSICMFLVYSLDHPFDGQDGIDNQPYRNVQQELKSYIPVLTPRLNNKCAYTATAD